MKNILLFLIITLSLNNLFGQNEELKKWKGKWKLKQLNTYQFNYEKITITDKEINFYNKENDTISLRTEKIKVVNYNPKEPLNVIFKNKEVWTFSVENVGNELRLFPYVKVNVNGETIIFLDERSIIRDSVLREKALAKEIRTYYVLEN